MMIVFVLKIKMLFQGKFVHTLNIKLNSFWGIAGYLEHTVCITDKLIQLQVLKFLKTLYWLAEYEQPFTLCDYDCFGVEDDNAVSGEIPQHCESQKLN